MRLAISYGRWSHRDKQVFHPLVQIYHKNVESIISRGRSSSLRIKRFLKIQNPIRFKDFMAEKLLEQAQLGVPHS